MAAQVITTTTFDAYLKEWYVDKKNLFKLDEYSNQLLGMFPKKPDASGDTWVVPVETSSPVGDSADYTTARANASAGQDHKFYGSWKERSAVAFMEHKLLKLSKDDRGSSKKASDKMESLRKQFLESTNIQLFRDEGGVIAQLGDDTNTTASTATGSLNASTKQMAQFLKVGMAINTGPNKDGSSLRSGDRYVRTVDPVAGTFTVDASQTSTTAGGGTWPTSTATGDYVFKDGDAAASLAGLEAWCPTTSPTAGASFKNVTRSTDARALAGIRIDASGMSVEEGLIQGVSDARQYGAATDIIFMHPKKVAQLVKELGDRCRYDRVAGVDFTTGKKSATIGFQALQVAVNGGPVSIIADAACQSTLGWVLEMKTWSFNSADSWPHVRNFDGLKLLRQTDTSYIFELMGIGEVLCFAPGRNANINFGA